MIFKCIICTSCSRNGLERAVLHVGELGRILTEVAPTRIRRHVFCPKMSLYAVKFILDPTIPLGPYHDGMYAAYSMRVQEDSAQQIMRFALTLAFSNACGLLDDT